MSKQLIAEAGSVSGSSKGTSIGGTITDGLKDSIGRHIELRMTPWTITTALEYAIKNDAAGVIKVIRGERKPMLRAELAQWEMMQRIATVIEEAQQS